MDADAREKTALRTFEWVEHSDSTSRIPNYAGDSGFSRGFVRVEFEATTVEEDRRLQVIPITEPVGVFLTV